MTALPNRHLPGTTADTPGAPAPGSPAREVELKLLAAAHDLAEIVRHPALVAYQAGTPTSRRLYTTYYDTPGLALLRHGLALRVRREGDRRIQAVKTVNSATPSEAAMVAVRREWEWPIDGDVPDLSLLAAEGVREVVPQDALSDLRPVFVTDFQRTSLTLHPDSLTVLEVALDTGEIRAGKRSRPVSEIELELKAGRIGRLFDLALELQRTVPLRIATQSKAEAGFALVTGRALAPRKARPLALTPATTVAEGFRHIVRNGLDQVLANEACVLAGQDPEGVHQMRVALRRLRSALSLFDSVITASDAGELNEGLRWLAGQLGPARDWDVLTGAFLRPFADDRDAAGLGPLVEAAADARRAAWARAVEAIRSPRYTTLLLFLGGWLEEGRWYGADDSTGTAAMPALLDRPLMELAGAWLSGRHRKVRRRGRHLRRLDAPDRHRLRIAVKKLRYATEFFRGLYPAAATRPYLGALETLQAVLGELQDIEVARHLVATLAEGTDARTRDAAKGFRRWLDERGRHRLDELPEAWRTFVHAEPFWIA